MEKARRTILSTAAFILVCFFLPWMQVSCLGAKDAVSGFELARDGERALWLVPLLMLAVLLLGVTRRIWERVPILLALGGMVGGLLSAYLMYREHSNTESPARLLAVFWTAWFWLGLTASLVLAAAGFWFYGQRGRAP
jgi:hypothetical protein